MSVLLSDAGTSLELQRSAGTSVDEFGDVYVAVRLVTARFNARNDTVWIAVAARDHFLAALNASNSRGTAKHAWMHCRPSVNGG
jgi:hypothetical protein